MLRNPPESGGPPASANIEVDDLVISTLTRTVTRAGQPIELTPREFSLLRFLALRAGQVASRSEIWDHVYEFHSDASSNVVDVYIGYLRKKLERDELPKIVHTKRGFGYSLGVKK